MANFFRCILILALPISFIGCASNGSSSAQRNFDDSNIKESAKVSAVLTPKKNISQELVKQGIVYLRDGNYEDSQKVFSAAI